MPAARFRPAPGSASSALGAGHLPRRDVPVLIAGVWIMDGPEVQERPLSVLGWGGDSSSRHRPGQVLADLALGVKVVQTVGCSTFTPRAKPATRRVADGERMNPLGRVARSRQYRGDDEHQDRANPFDNPPALVLLPSTSKPRKPNPFQGERRLCSLSYRVNYQADAVPVLMRNYIGATHGKPAFLPE